MKKDDLLWKALLEDVFDDFLLFFFKEQASIFDFDKGFGFLDKELEQLFPTEEANQLRFVDKLVKVFTKEGNEEWVLVHVEIQGYNDPDFGRRMFTYFYRILDKYNRHVTAIAIFTGNNRRYMPGEYNYSFLGVENTFKFNTYRIIDQEEANLLNDTNPFALVVATALMAIKQGKTVEEELLQLRIDILNTMAKKLLPPKKRMGIMNFLKHYVHFEKPENNAKFEEAITTITGKNATNMGTEEYLLQKAKKEGKQEGREEERVILAKNLLANTEFDDEKIASLASIAPAVVKQLRVNATNNCK